MDEAYEKLINKLKKLHKHYYNLLPHLTKISEKTITRTKMELIETILASENIEVTRTYD
jgi:hypothetical protein